jgi:hypothetical protein
MNIVGQVIDSVTKEPIVGAIVYISDTAGKPISKAVSTDSNGRYSLTDVSSNSIIASSAITYPVKVTSIKNAIKTPFGFPALLIKLTQGKEGTFEEVKITADKTVKEKDKEKEKDKAKEPMKLWVKIALGVGAVTVLGIIIFLATKENKKGKK